MWQQHPIPEAPVPISLGPRPRILVVKLAGLGDLLLATPALRALRARYPTARIDALVTTEAAPLLRDAPLVDHIFRVEKYAYDAPAQVARHPERLARLIQPLAALRHERYDALLLPHHLTLRFGRLKYRALLAAVGARVTVGLDNGWGDFLDLRVPDRGFGARHEAEYALDVVAAIDATLPLGARGLRMADLGWEEGFTSREERPVLQQAKTPRIALHPGGGTYSLARRWPAARFAEVAATLHREMGAACVLVGGAEERALHAEILDRLDHPSWGKSVAGATDPRALAHVLAGCALFIGNDSLPMHLATAMGLPVVAVFGPSNARAWGPYSPDAPERAAIVRRSDLACSPCFYRGHALGTPQGCPPRPCLTELSAQPVLAAARRLLRRSGIAVPPAG
ncbi:MAG: glycosyltransferase family 9 protein [Ktedonobacterales bacterium]|nr:glycosyltransferase family 9 protein [Ktedonobacterales bacterium]